MIRGGVAFDLRISEVSAHTWLCPRRRCRHGPGPDFIYDNGDVLGIAHLLAPEQGEPNGFYTSYGTGTCAACQCQYIAAMVNMIDADVDDKFRDHWLWRNRDMGTPRLFVAKSHGVRWQFERYISPLGPVDSHEIGPLVLDWTRPWCPDLQKRTIDVWNEFRAISRLRL